MTIKKASMADVEAIHQLILKNANEGVMLARAKADIYSNIRDFFVAKNDAGRVIGCSALHVVWADLAEIRSLAVEENSRNKGIGAMLVKACIEEAKELDIKQIFTLTYVPEFFKKLGFIPVDKNTLPRKIWSDCVNCPLFPDCKEEALELWIDRTA